MRLLTLVLPRGSWVVLGAIALLGGSLGVGSQAVQARPQPAAPVAVANNPATLALAKHLQKIGAKMYGAYWCPHCERQTKLFGTAFQAIDYVECDPRGKKPRPQLCKAAKIQGYPTWEIKGKLYPGVRSLEELAKTSGYSGKNDF